MQLDTPFRLGLIVSLGYGLKLNILLFEYQDT